MLLRRALILLTWSLAATQGAIAQLYRVERAGSATISSPDQHGRSAAETGGSWKRT
jgi:hypothetical protein